MSNTKISIRFFNDREVRAVWDEQNAKWWFNVIDIVAILNEQDDYTKANNYWRWLKRKLKSENNQLVSATHGFKIVAADGKIMWQHTTIKKELHVERSQIQRSGKKNNFIYAHITRRFCSRTKRRNELD